MKFGVIVFLPLFSLCIFGCATTGKRPVSSDSFSRTDERPGGHPEFPDVSSHPGEHPREIVGSGPGGRVLHRDIVNQQAESGDYITVFNGEKLKEPMALRTGDIEYSKEQVRLYRQALLDTGPDSVRALLTDIVSSDSDDPVFNASVPTPVQEMNLYTEVLPGTLEFISDVRNRKQTILITTQQANWPAYDARYKNPPWVIKEKVDLSSGLISIILLKKVDSDQDTIISYSEDIETTKKRLKEVKAAKPVVVPPNPEPKLKQAQAPVLPSIDFGIGVFWPGLIILPGYLQAVSPSAFGFGYPVQLGVYASVEPVVIGLFADAQGGVGFGPELLEGSVGGSFELGIGTISSGLGFLGFGVGYGWYGYATDDTWENILGGRAITYKTSYLRLGAFLAGGSGFSLKLGVYTQFFGDGTWGLGLVYYMGWGTWE